MENEVARVIKAQLGGVKFERMTGANTFTTNGNNLGFKIPGRKINQVTISLKSGDVYDVTFYKYSAISCKLKKVKKFYDVEADNLSTVFEQATGLLT